MPKSKQTKAHEIPQEVKAIVYERDDYKCILCYSCDGLPNAHYIPRSKGGLGIEQNIITLCPRCHYKLDFTSDRKYLLKLVKRHLDRHYKDFTDEERVYKKC